MTAQAWIACGLLAYIVFLQYVLIPSLCDQRDAARRLADESTVQTRDAMRQARANAEKRCEVGR